MFENCKIIDEYRKEEVTKPYDVIPRIDDTRDDQWILNKWLLYFKKKDHPFVVVSDNETGIVSVFVNQMAEDNVYIKK